MDAANEIERRRRLSAIAIFLLIDHERQNNLKNAKKKRMWARKLLQRRNDSKGVLAMLFTELGPEDPKSIKNNTRMGEALMDELLVDITPLIRKQNTVMRKPISPRERLATTLRFLATGNTYKDLAYSTQIAPNTISKIVSETLRALATVLERKNVIKLPSESLEWKAVAGNFHTLWQFPNCIGALDGKHIRFRPPRKEGSKSRNYTGYDSIVLLALVDANYQFIFVNIGRNGRNDAAVFRESHLSEQLTSGSLNLPQMDPLPGATDPMPYVIVADDAFPLKINIMKPYPARELNIRTRIFNYRLSRARRVAENAFGILSTRFAILSKPIPLRVEKVELIVYTCCLLHNFLLQRYAEGYIPTEYQDGSGQSNLTGLSQQGGNRNADTALHTRHLFTDYFNGIGKSSPRMDLTVSCGGEKDVPPRMDPDFTEEKGFWPKVDPDIG